MAYPVKIKSIEPVTHNVHNFVVEKPSGFDFKPGQATDVSIDEEGWREEKRPFTFTSLPDWDDLHFTIKHYSDHNGVTKKLSEALVGDQLLIGDPWGAIHYEGPGTFIAGGAGITPFIAILRMLNDRGNLAGHRLIFANETEADIILRNELEKMPGLDIVYVLSGDEGKTEFRHGFIDEQLISELTDDPDQFFYICGPEPMEKQVQGALDELAIPSSKRVTED